MLYELISEKNTGTDAKPRLVRTYRNTKTFTETKLNHIHTDKEGMKWWGFQDLFKIPMMRMSMVRNITDLYTIGLTLKDIITWCDQETTLLRSNDPEKYEKLYALVLEKRKLAEHTADPIRQQLALCTVYILADDERIDYFDEQEAEKKLNMWKAYPNDVSFFLTWHTNHIQGYIRDLNKISETVLKLEATAKEMVSDPAAQLKPFLKLD